MTQGMRGNNGHPRPLAGELDACVEGVTTRKCQNCPVRENPKGTILGLAREFAPLKRLEDTADGHLVVAPSEKKTSA
jgi:hypothetical protein